MNCQIHLSLNEVRRISRKTKSNQNHEMQMWSARTNTSTLFAWEIDTILLLSFTDVWITWIFSPRLTCLFSQNLRILTVSHKAPSNQPITDFVVHWIIYHKKNSTRWIPCLFFCCTAHPFQMVVTYNFETADLSGNIRSRLKVGLLWSQRFCLFVFSNQTLSSVVQKINK